MLWAHYAGGHTGVSIHFRADERAVMGGAMEVTYHERRPTLPLDVHELPENEVFARLLLQKGKFWAYEDEYRFANYPNMDWTGFPIEFRGQRGRFKPRELSGVTVGARILGVNLKKLMRIAEEHNPPLPVWRPLETDTFKFEFERIA